MGVCSVPRAATAECSHRSSVAGFLTWKRFSPLGGHSNPILLVRSIRQEPHTAISTGSFPITRPSHSASRNRPPRFSVNHHISFTEDTYEQDFAPLCSRRPYNEHARRGAFVLDAPLACLWDTLHLEVGRMLTACLRRSSYFRRECRPSQPARQSLRRTPAGSRHASTADRHRSCCRQCSRRAGPGDRSAGTGRSFG